MFDASDLAYSSLDPVIVESLNEYGKNGRPTGDFLKAVLSNDLFQAFGRADLHNTRTMYVICMYIYNELPSPCHGSPEKVEAWIKAHKPKTEEATPQA